MAAIVQLIKDGDGFMALRRLKDIPAEYINEAGNFLSYRQIVDMAEELFHLSEQATEFLYAMAFDVRMRLLGVLELGHGSEREVRFELRDLFAGMILMRASRFLLIHNHVHGLSEPSKGDIQKTEEVERGAVLMGFEFLNHIVTGNGGFTLIKRD